MAKSGFVLNRNLMFLSDCLDLRTSTLEGKITYNALLVYYLFISVISICILAK